MSYRIDFNDDQRTITFDNLRVTRRRNEQTFDVSTGNVFLGAFVVEDGDVRAVLVHALAIAAGVAGYDLCDALGYKAEVVVKDAGEE